MRRPGDTTLAIDHHDVTAANVIDQLITVNMLNSTGVQPYLYDAAGNLLFNGGALAALAGVCLAIREWRKSRESEWQVVSRPR